MPRQKMDCQGVNSNFESSLEIFGACRVTLLKFQLGAGYEKKVWRENKTIKITSLQTSANLLFPTLGDPKLYMVTEIAPCLVQRQ